MDTELDTRRAELVGLARCFTDPYAPHDSPEPPGLTRSWIVCLDAARTIAARYRSDYDRNGALAVIAEPTRLAAVLHLTRAWASCVDAYLSEEHQP